MTEKELLEEYKSKLQSIADTYVEKIEEDAFDPTRLWWHTHWFTCALGQLNEELYIARFKTDNGEDLVDE